MGVENGFRVYKGFRVRGCDGSRPLPSPWPPPRGDGAETSSGTQCRVSGLGFRVSGFGFRVSGFGFRVSGLGFRV